MKENNSNNIKFIFKENFKEFVFGFQDGLISTYVLLVGIAILVILNPVLLIITLLAEIASGAVSMTVGAYISIRTENELKNKFEDIDMDINFKIKKYLKVEDFSNDELENFKQFFNTHPKIWEKIENQNNQLISKRDPLDIAILMGISFILGGIIPLVPYLIPLPTWSFLIATIASFTGLFMLGILRNKISKSKKHWIKPALEMILIGILAVIIIEIYIYFISLTYGWIIFS
ncbi:MAG: VIT1/CCC1 transporter family protein [Candidatus Helarchaeota archaeon]